MEAQEQALPAIADFIDAIEAARDELETHLNVARSYEGGDEMCDEIESVDVIDERALESLARGYRWHMAQIKKSQQPDPRNDP